MDDDYDATGIALAHLHDLLFKYGSLIDRRDWAGLDDIFTPDIVFDMTDIKRGVIEGLESLKRYMGVDAVHPLAHLVTNIYAEELSAGAGAGRMRCRLLAVQGNGTVIVGEYRDRVVRTPAGWRISERVFTYQRRPAG